MSDVARGNLFDGADPPASGEAFEALLRQGGALVERIVSSATPDTSPYVQDHDEWVVLLRGEATLEVEGELLELRPGDQVHLPARTRHIVRRTSDGALWLAVHLPA